MKKFMVIAAMLFAGAVQAEEPKWKAQLENYKADMQSVSTSALYVYNGVHSLKAMGTCSANVAIAASAFIGDTLPLGALVISEPIANGADPNYESYQQFWSWENLGNLFKGLGGGVTVAGYDAVNWIFLWLGGNEDQAFEALKNTYASSWAATEKLFAEQGQCMMSVAKVALIRMEMRNRGIDAVPWHSNMVNKP